MSAFTVESHLDEGYVQGTITEQFRVFGVNQMTQSTDAANFEQALVTHLDAATSPARVLLDLRALKMNFSDLVQGLGMTRSEGKLFRHPNAAEFVIITTSSLLKLASEALAQVQYGERKVRVFSSPEEAVEYAKSPRK